MKRSAEEIMNDINPMNSVKRYDNSWSLFVSYVNLGDRRPSEDEFIQYFHYLKNDRKLAASTIWSHYSMINHKYQTQTGQKLQMYPRITMLLKSFEAGYVRKSANIFSKNNMDEFLTKAPDTGDFIHIKAGVVVAYCGGLRMADLASIQTDDFEFNETTGMWINYHVSKQRGEQITNKFNVPIAYCKHLELYDHKLHDSNASGGRFMKTYRSTKEGKSYYTNQPMGIHTIRKFTLKMAEFLKLPNPQLYTGHAIRRTAANVMAEGGASTSVMKKHFNWKSDNTALKYLENTTNGKLGVSRIMQPSTSASSGKSNSTLQPSEFTQKPIEQKVINLHNCQNIILNL